MEIITLILVFTVMLGIGILLAFYGAYFYSTDKIEGFVDAEFRALKIKLRSKKIANVKHGLS
jgi:hypothetical protein